MHKPFLFLESGSARARESSNQTRYLLQSELKVLCIVLAWGDAAPPTQGHRFLFWWSFSDRSAPTVFSLNKLSERCSDAGTF